MAGEKKILTYAGLRALEDELENLKVVRRKEVAVKIREAREQGDLSENAEYDAAREEQARIDTEIKELEDIIRNAVVIEDEVHTSNIGKLITIVYEDDESTEEFLLVSSSLEADPMQGKISKESPLGKAVFEANIGSKVVVKPESGDDFVVLIKNIKESK